MLAPALPPNEHERLASLAEHQLLDTLPEDVFDDITRLAAEICGTPTAAINLIAGDRQWTKAGIGALPSGTTMPRGQAFCSYTILSPDEPLVVPDARYDERFHDNPLVEGDPCLAFYAGVPVKDSEGRALGALCICDERPRELPEYKIESLKALAKLVNTHFQLRLAKLRLASAQQQISTAQPLLQRLDSDLTSLQSKAGAQAMPELGQISEQVRTLQQTLRLTAP
jgi:GAF domain-containing protein